MGSSIGSSCNTSVSASRSRSLLTNFGRRVRTTTNEAGRRSTVSATSSPIFSKAASPSCCTSGGKTSISTRGSFSGNGLRPVGFCRVCACTCSSSGGGAGAIRRACSHRVTEFSKPLRALRKRDQTGSALRASAFLGHVRSGRFQGGQHRFGHLAGNAALKHVSALLRGFVRETDVAGRYGGDEFMALLPETPKHIAEGLAAEIQAMAEGMRLMHEAMNPEE
jgi:Diguanylate cyclase, GGDEF domain